LILNGTWPTSSMTDNTPIWCTSASALDTVIKAAPGGLMKLGDGGPEVLGVKMPLVCQHLKYNPKTGVSSCAIYENRPKVCRDFLCEAAKDK